MSVAARADSTATSRSRYHCVSVRCRCLLWPPDNRGRLSHSPAVYESAVSNSPPAGSSSGSQSGELRGWGGPAAGTGGTGQGLPTRGAGPPRAVLVVHTATPPDTPSEEVSGSETQEVSGGGLGNSWSTGPCGWIGSVPRARAITTAELSSSSGVPHLLRTQKQQMDADGGSSQGSGSNHSSIQSPTRIHRTAAALALSNSATS